MVLKKQFACSLGLTFNLVDVVSSLPHLLQKNTLFYVTFKIRANVLQKPADCFSRAEGYCTVPPPSISDYGTKLQYRCIRNCTEPAFTHKHFAYVNF